jgi:hypothetical protein
MWECRHCGEFLQGERDRLPTRCPRCREPLFERAGGPVLVEEQYPEKGVCALHPGNVALGTCKRCGNFFCPVCRSRWQERTLCLACVERLLASGEKNPEERRGHGRQAVLGCILGLTAWVALVVAVLLVLPVVGNRGLEGLLVLSGLLILAAFLCALFGLGQAVTAIRTRGHRMFAATSGLILSSCFLGAIVGFLLLQAGRH